MTKLTNTPPSYVKFEEIYPKVKKAQPLPTGFVQDIRRYGLQSPVVVVPVKDVYLILDGEKRYQAIKRIKSSHPADYNKYFNNGVWVKIEDTPKKYNFDKIEIDQIAEIISESESFAFEHVLSAMVKIGFTNKDIAYFTNKTIRTVTRWRKKLQDAQSQKDT